MFFNSLVFIIFIGIFYALWPFMSQKKTSRWVFLSVCSCVFYGWWDWRFLFLLVGSGCINYFAGKVMVSSSRLKKAAMFSAVFLSLSSLAIFKYSGFVADILDSLLISFELPPIFRASIPPFLLITPVGISFFTFQALSYSIDLYYGRIQPAQNFLHFFSYLSLFPQLVAGPIVRASDMLSQLLKKATTTDAQRWEGSRLIVEGFFKKIVIADNLAPFVNDAFAMDQPPDSWTFWLARMVMFSFQIYYDFKGYSDIARGLCQWMGYSIPLNFNHPYLACGLSDFWKRWHISLSSWFRDYLYIPLGGSRVSTRRMHANLWVTMLASGLWHGAGWGFIAWGALHALYLSWEQLTKWPERLASYRWGRVFGVGCTFMLATLGWVYFRASSIGQAHDILSSIFLFHSENTPGIGKAGWFFIALAISSELICFLSDRRWFIRLRNAWEGNLEVIAFAGMVGCTVFFRGVGNAFIYFQF